MQSVPIHGRSPVPKMASCVKESSKFKKNRFPQDSWSLASRPCDEARWAGFRETRFGSLYLIEKVSHIETEV